MQDCFIEVHFTPSYARSIPPMPLVQMRSQISGAGWIQQPTVGIAYQTSTVQFISDLEFQIAQLNSQSCQISQHLGRDISLIMQATDCLLEITQTAYEGNIWTIDSTVEGNGQLQFDQQVKDLQPLDISIIPDPGYQLAALTSDHCTLTEVSEQQFRIEQVSQHCHLSAQFSLIEIDQIAITHHLIGSGSINIASSMPENEHITFELVADEGFDLKSINGDHCQITRENDQQFSLRSTTNDCHVEITLKEQLTCRPQIQTEGVTSFYDQDADGNDRQLSNHLMGDLRGHLQFLQSHQMNAFASDSHPHLPDLISQRDALLLFFPLQNKLNDCYQVEIEQAQGIQRLTLNPPDQLPRSDFDNNALHHDVVYSTKAWSIPLDWTTMQPGLNIRLYNQLKQSADTIEPIDFAPPTELLIYSARLGMLTGVNTSNTHNIIEQPEALLTDYFQTIPVAKIIAARFEDITLDKVMVSDGTIYLGKSNDEGSVYKGDMRASVAKYQFSLGVNLANYGISSSSNREYNPYLMNIQTIHHAQGNYNNGIQVHGLSGGNGIITLVNSTANEFSHELGHSFSLGHYPGKQGDNYHWAVHHHDSGWGYIAHRNRLRSNLNWYSELGSTTVDKQPMPSNFKNLYDFNKDAMSGGSGQSSLSQVTHHTGYSAQVIQDFINNKMIADLSFHSGYKQWDNSKQQFVDAQFNNQFMGQTIKRPEKIGVEVYTILGAYDPGNKTAVLFPVLKSSYGHVFDLHQDSIAANACSLQIDFADGSQDHIALSGYRYETARVNQLQVNIEAARQPQQIRLLCQQQEIALLTFEQNDYDLQPMPTTLIGQAHRYNQLQTLELNTLNAALIEQEQAETVQLSSDITTLIGFYKDKLELLAPNARSTAERYFQHQQALVTLNSWIRQYQDDLINQQNNRINELNQKLAVFGSNLAQLQSIEPQYIQLSSQSVCLNKMVNNHISAVNCSDVSKKKWIVSPNGSIHSQVDYGLCLKPRGNDNLQVASCGNAGRIDQWQQQQDKTITYQDRCVDYVASKNKAILYPCHGGNNQQWNPLNLQDVSIFDLLDADNLTLIQQVTQ